MKRVRPAETVADAIADELARCGVDRVFGVPGGEVLQLIEALRSRGIDYALCRHEAHAGIAAAVYGKLRRTAGVVLTTLGPGAANLMLPLANSLLDREPLLAISAQVPDDWPPQRTHQRLPLLDAYAPVTKASGSIDSGNCSALIRSAVATTLAEPQGPVFLTLSADVARTDLDGGGRRTGDEPVQAPLARSTADEAAAELRRRLQAAERPVVVVGLGTRPQASDALRAWLEAWRLPVAVTPKAKGIVDETDGRFVGVVGGMAVDAVVREALARSDLLVGFGLDPVEIDGAWHLELPVVWMLESAWATGAVPASDVVVTDLGEMLGALVGPAPRTWTDPFDELRRVRSTLLGRDRDLPGISPLAIVRALAAAAPAETIVTTDVGSHKYVFGQFWPSRRPETFFMSNGLSGMGYAIPAAIGAKLARPDTPVLAIVGDGGFSMGSAELETARRLRSPFVTVVLADGEYSLIRIAQERRGLERSGVDFGPIDSVLTARACGVEAARIAGEAELTNRVASALASDEALLVEVPVDADEYRGIV